jgi:hypothetical protein
MTDDAANPPKTPHFELAVHEPLSERLEMIRVISNRLCIALAALLTVLIAGAYLVSAGRGDAVGATSWMVLITGILGGFIGLQRRLKAMEHDDLLLLARSWVYVLLSPLVGGILSLLLFILFISGLVEGDLFPKFAADALSIDGGNLFPQCATDASGSDAGDSLMKLVQIHAVGYEDYAKLVFWCFLAGYSEKFVTNIISRFESGTSEEGNPTREHGQQP